MLFDALIPHDGNTFTPKLIQKSALFAMTFMIVASFLVANMQALLWQGSDWLVGAILPAVIVQETNNARDKAALPPLQRSAVLDDAAQRKAEHMVAEKYFAHDSPEGITPWHWFKEANYTYAYAGENLAVHFNDSKDVVEAWLNSPTHRANIVGGNYTEIGIGTAKGRFEGYDTVFVVQLFGTPAQPVKEKKQIPTDALGTMVIDVASTTATGTATTTLDVATSTDDVTLAAVAGDFTVNESIEESKEVESVTSRSLVAMLPEEQARPTSDTVIVLDPVATSSGLVPVADTASGTGAYNESPGVAQLATQPNRVLQTIYVVLGFGICFALIASIVLAWRTHSVRYVLQGVALLVLMSILFYVHVLVTSGVVIL